jgi:Uncharacterized protein conserved in bacteria
MPLSPPPFRAWCTLGLLLGGLLLIGCLSTDSRPVRTGAEVLAADDFSELAGKEIGLIVNHTARVDTAHLIDRVDRSPAVELGALFGPEHGLRGTAGAGEAVADGRDEKTGAPVYSLYGETRRPTPKELEGLDALVFDVQDVGARFYTYITTMGLAMQAAAEADLEFVVLDRPNPLGGTYVSGFMLTPEHQSFVGRYPIPVAHGMTVGELARMIKGEAMLPGLDDLELTVVEMEGWTRNLRWPGTKRDWVPPSPNLPTWETALVYPGMCFFEGVRVNEAAAPTDRFSRSACPGPAPPPNRLSIRCGPGPSPASPSTRPQSRPRPGPRPPRRRASKAVRCTALKSRSRTNRTCCPSSSACTPCTPPITKRRHKGIPRSLAGPRT